MKLKDIKIIEGTIKLKTGLHIGTGTQEIHIGGLDNPVIRHPHTRLPYIPGSSIKGKMRSLLELKSGYMQKTEGKVLNSSHLNNTNTNNQLDKTLGKLIIKIFGEGAGKEGEQMYEITRASFWDAYLNKEYYDKQILEKNLILTETKFENVINRLNGTAQHPRQIERVPEGAIFDFKISLKIFDIDDENQLIETILKGMKLIEFDGLGGSISRGYGKVQFEIIDEGLKSKYNSIHLETIFS